MVKLISDRSPQRIKPSDNMLELSDICSWRKPKQSAPKLNTNL